MTAQGGTIRWSEAAIGIAVLAALGIAALVPALRLPLVAALVALLLLSPRGAWRWAAAAGLPVALMLLWGDLVAARLPAGDAACADLRSLLAWQRVAEAGLVIGVIVLLARFQGTSLRALGLRRPTPIETTLVLVAVLVIPVPSLYLGPILAEPFFGSLGLDLSQPAAIVPALLLALANGTMEELAYRGALLAWLPRATGPTIALVGQAVVFGAAHTGPDYVSSPLAPVLAVMAGGLVAGLIVRRTGSLWLPIAVHVALDVPLYYAAACLL